MKNNTKNIVLILLMGILSFVFLLNSPLHPWIGSDSDIDSSVFKTVVLMMEKGYMPYKDSFDHKGPLIYALNWLGNRISQYKGIWVIEFLFLTATFTLMYKISRLKSGVSSSILSVLTAGSLLFQYFEGGNFTEEYAMMFISMSLYIFLDYLLNNKITKIRLMLCGFGLGATLLLRANMISVWVVFCLLILGQTLQKKDWNKLKGFICWFMIGLCICVGPILIWLAANDALLSCWESYIVFNRAYTSTEYGAASLAAKWSSCIYFFNTAVFVIAFFIVIYLCKLGNRVLNFAYLFYMVITLGFICMSGQEYGHYGMIIVPMITYPIASLFSEVEKIKDANLFWVASVCINIFLLTTIIMPDWLSLVAEIPTIYESKNSENRSEISMEIRDMVDGYTDPDDTISVYGNWDFLYVMCNRKHATRYSYQFPISQIMPRIMDEYMLELKQESPKLIVIQPHRYDENIADFLESNEYDLIWSQNRDDMDGASVYVKR